MATLRNLEISEKILQNWNLHKGKLSTEIKH